MASKGRMALQHHLPPFAQGAPFPYDLDRKLDLQHLEIKKLAIENQRLADSHHSSRRQLAVAQHDLQMLQAHTEAVKADDDQQFRGITEKINKMEAELKSSHNIKSDLQNAHSEAQNLVAVRQDLFSKVQTMNQDLQKSIADMQQMPALMSELDSLRQEYQQLRAAYDYEMKLRLDHYESLQLMEKNYVAMVQELEKLRSELANSAGTVYGISSQNNTSAQVQTIQGGQTVQFSGNPLGTNPSRANTGNNQAPAPSTNPNPTPNPTQGASPYGPAQAHMAFYGTTQAPQSFYGAAQVPQNVYGSAQYIYGPSQVPANSYGLLTQAPNQQVPPQHYGSVSYSSAPAPAPPPSHASVQGQNNPARK